MSWKVTIHTHLRYSVQIPFATHLRPGKSEIVRELHTLFPDAQKSLRSELIERVNAGRFACVFRQSWEEDEAVAQGGIA